MPIFMRPNGRSIFAFLAGMTFLLGCAHAIVSEGGGRSTTIIPDNNICTNHKDGYVRIEVPGPGEVTVTAQAMIGLKHHSEGGGEMAMMHIGNTAGDCTMQNSFQYSSQNDDPEPKGGPSGSIERKGLIPVEVSRTFHVDSAGTKTFFLNSLKLAGDGTVIIWESSLKAVYYPEP